MGLRESLSARLDDSTVRNRRKCTHDACIFHIASQIPTEQMPAKLRRFRQDYLPDCLVLQMGPSYLRPHIFFGPSCPNIVGVFTLSTSLIVQSPLLPGGCFEKLPE